MTQLAAFASVNTWAVQVTAGAVETLCSSESQGAALAG